MQRPALKPTLSSGANAQAAQAMDLDEEFDDNVTEEHVKIAGTNLILGIPCIISPRNAQTGKTAKLRATVKYIGPLKGRRGSWLGVEVPFPLPTGFEEDFFGGFNDGSEAGIRYFGLGLPAKANAQDENDQDMTGIDRGDSMLQLERRARRRRIAGVVRAASEALSSGGSDYAHDVTALAPGSTSLSDSVSSLSPEDSAAGLPSAKRLKGLHGTGTATMRRQLSSDREAPGEVRGLFIRPAEVLFVVSPEGL